MPALVEPFMADVNPAVRADFARVCADLASMLCAAPPTHGDLHGGNLLVDGACHRIADWGDGAVAHPFSSLFVTYDLAVGRFEPADRRTATVRLRDAYFDAWPEVGSPATLREAFRLAVWTGYVTRALTWIRMVEGAPPAVASEWHGHAAAMLAGRPRASASRRTRPLQRDIAAARMAVR